MLLVRSFHSRIYSEFTRRPEKFRCLNFLFCFSSERMQKKYMLSKKRSENQIKDQIKYLKTINTTFKFLVVTFSLFVSKMAYDNIYLNNLTNSDGLFINYLLIVIKIIGYLLFSIALMTYLLTDRLGMNELIVSSVYLSNRLEDLIDEILELFSNDQYQNRNYVDKEGIRICQNYADILKYRFEMEQHFNRTLNFLLVLFLFDIIYPAIIILDQNKNKSMIFFYISNYLIILSNLFSLFYFNTKFLNSVMFALLN